MSEERKRRVVSKDEITHKRSGISKFVSTFLKGDMTSIVGHLVDDILIPSAVETMNDMGHNLVDGIMYGNDSSKGSKKGYYSRKKGHTSYDKISSGKSSKSSISRSGSRRRSLQFDDILFDERRDAEEVLAMLRSDLEENDWGSVSVGDFYDKYEEVTDVEIRPRDFTEQKYGWEDLDDARVVAVRTSEGRQWYIDFPRAESLAD